MSVRNLVSVVRALIKRASKGLTLLDGAGLIEWCPVDHGGAGPFLLGRELFIRDALTLFLLIVVIIASGEFNILHDIL